MTDLPNLKMLLPYFLLIGALTAYVAHNKRGRRPIPWFFLGFFFGLLALLTVFFLPKKEPLQQLLLKGNINHPLPLITPVIETETHPMTKELWYFLDENRSQIGPLSFHGLKNKYIEGKVLPSSYVWNAQMDDWKRLEALSEYLSIIEERTT
jgi:hypothetical protein